MIIDLVNFFSYCTIQTGKDVVTKNFLQCMWKVQERQLMESVWPAVSRDFAIFVIFDLLELELYQDPVLPK